MNHTVPLPPRSEIRALIGASISSWARNRSLPPHAVHMTITRYAGTDVDMSRPWGAQTRRVLLALDEAVRSGGQESA